MKPASSALPSVGPARRLAIATLLLASLLLTACATFQKPAADADYGPPPTRFTDAARAEVELAYPVPAGSTFEFGEPVRAYINNGLALGGEVAWLGWLVDVKVASPEVAAPKPFMVFFRDGRVTRVLDLAEHPLVNRVE